MCDFSSHQINEHHQQLNEINWSIDEDESKYCAWCGEEIGGIEIADIVSTKFGYSYCSTDCLEEHENVK